jgi:hypothetical protein
MTRLLSLLSLALLVAPPALASAQTITVHDITIDDDPPPEEYRALLDAAISEHLPPIRECYVRTLATHPGLGGDLRLRLWVSARQVIRVTPESSLGDAALETCAHDRVHEFTLPPQAPEGGARVRFVMTFVPGAAASTPPPPPSTPPIITPMAQPPRPPIAHTPTIALDRLRGALSQEALTFVLGHDRFAQCTTTQTGALPISVSIDRRGRAHASAGRSTLRDTAYRTCVVSAIEAAQFPTASGNTRVRVTITP